jgi:hypothetical protein
VVDVELIAEDEAQRFDFLVHGVARFLRQRSLQYFTSFHTFSHFLRQLNGLWQVTQILDGRCCFFTWE